MDRIPEIELSYKVVNEFVNEELVEIVNNDKIEIKMMYPLLNMRNGFDRCFLRKSVADMLIKASKSLDTGYKFLVWDAWRPFALQKELFEVYSKDIIKTFNIRYNYAYGKQNDYFDDQNVVGWTREGVDEFKNSGLAVILSDGAGGNKNMYVGKAHTGEIWIDALNHTNNEVTIDENGNGEFVCDGGSVSVYINKDSLK